MFNAMNDSQDQARKIRSEAKDGKLTDDDQKKVDTLEASVGEQRDKISAVAGEYAGGNPLVRQLIDLAPLSSGLLKGRDLSEFVKRSVSLL